MVLPQLPASLAEKNKLVLYPLYVMLKKQYNNRAAVRQCSSTYGSKGQRCAAVGTVVLSSTSGRPIFYTQKKRFISHRTKKTPTYGTAHPPHRPNLYYIQQYSSAAVRTAVQQCSSTYSSAPAPKKKNKLVLLHHPQSSLCSLSTKNTKK